MYPGFFLILQGIARYFHEYLLKLNLLQKNFHQNIANNTFDLILSSAEHCTVEIPDGFISKIDIFHPSLEINVNLSKIEKCLRSSSRTKVSRTEIIKYDFKNANYKLLNTEINKIEWNEELENLIFEYH